MGCGRWQGERRKGNLEVISLALPNTGYMALTATAQRDSGDVTMRKTAITQAKNYCSDRCSFIGIDVNDYLDTLNFPYYSVGPT